MSDLPDVEKTVKVRHTTGAMRLALTGPTVMTPAASGVVGKRPPQGVSSPMRLVCTICMAMCLSEWRTAGTIIAMTRPLMAALGRRTVTACVRSSCAVAPITVFCGICVPRTALGFRRRIAASVSASGLSRI